MTLKNSLFGVVAWENIKNANLVLFAPQMTHNIVARDVVYIHMRLVDKYFEWSSCQAAPLSIFKM